MGCEAGGDGLGERRRGASGGGPPVVPEAPLGAASVGTPPSSSLASLSSSGDDENCVVVEGNEFCAVDVGDGGDVAEDSAGAGPVVGALGALVTVVPFFLWGTTMVAMKTVLPHTSSPFFVAAVRCVPAGALILGMAKAQGKAVVPVGAAAWAWVLAFAAVDAAAFQGCLIEGLERTNAGLGSVIIDSQPISVALASAVLFGETLGPRGYLGLVLGVLGISLVEVPAEAAAEMLRGFTDGTMGLGAVGSGLGGLGGAGVPGGGWTGLWDRGEWWMLLAAQSMAAGTIMVRYFSKHIDPVVATGWHLLLGGIPLAALALRDGASDPGGAASLVSHLTGGDWASLGYASVLGGAVGYGVFFYLASKGNLTKLSALTFLTPLFACTAGFVLLGERLDAEQLVGAAITLVAIALITVKTDDAPA